MIVVDGVERAGQVCVENPHPFGLSAAQGGEPTPDRVVAAATGPEPVTSGLEPGFPLGFQGMADSCLMTPVHDHRDAERPLLDLVMGLRNVHRSEERRVGKE